MLRLAIITTIIAVQLAAAQLLSAYDQAYGQWKIKLNRNVFGDNKWHIETIGPQQSRGAEKQNPTKANVKKSCALQLMFPNQPMFRRDNGYDGVTNELEEQTSSEIDLPLTHKPVKSINCILNLKRNGKFTIHLQDQHENVNINYCNNYQPLNGEWFLTPNPYCVTDRHYDEITLISAPRIRRVYLSTSTVVEKATVELRCKLWGRYSAGAVRRKLGMKHGRSRSRMTHGHVLTVKETFSDNGGGSLGEATKQLPQRDVVGSFCGKAVDLADTDNQIKVYAADNVEEDDLDAIYDEDDNYILL